LNKEKERKQVRRGGGKKILAPAKKKWGLRLLLEGTNSYPAPRRNLECEQCYSFFLPGCKKGRSKLILGEGKSGPSCRGTYSSFGGKGLGTAPSSNIAKQSGCGEKGILERKEGGAMRV